MTSNFMEDCGPCRFLFPPLLIAQLINKKNKNYESKINDDESRVSTKKYMFNLHDKHMEKSHKFNENP
jgi:hypothetical protein